MNSNKEVKKVVSAIISLINNYYSCLVELLGVLTVMLARKRLVKKSLLLLMSSNSKTQNVKKGSKNSPLHFRVRPLTSEFEIVEWFHEWKHNHSFLQGWNLFLKKIKKVTSSFWQPSTLIYVNCMKHFKMKVLLFLLY